MAARDSACEPPSAIWRAAARAREKVARAASLLHHAVSEGDAGGAVVSYVLVFFAIWWAWMNFSWFATAFDVDDVPYRLTTLVQIAGGLVVAAGVPAAFAGNFSIITFGSCMGSCGGGAFICPS